MTAVDADGRSTEKPNHEWCGNDESGEPSMQHAKDYWTVTRIHSPTRPLDASLPPLYKPHGGLDTPSASLKGRDDGY